MFNFNWSGNGTTAFYPIITYAFNTPSGGSLNVPGKLSYNYTNVDIPVSPPGPFTSMQNYPYPLFMRYIHYFAGGTSPTVNSADFQDYRACITTGVPANNSGSAVVFWLTDRSPVTCGLQGAQVGFRESNTGSGGVFQLGAGEYVGGRRYMTGPAGSFRMRQCFYNLSVPTFSSPDYSGSLATTPDYPDQYDNVGNGVNTFAPGGSGNWADTPFETLNSGDPNDTTDFKAYFDEVETFMKDFGNDYIRLYEDLAVVQQQLLAAQAEQARLLAASGATLEEGTQGTGRFGESAVEPAFVVEDPFMDLDTPATSKLRKKAEKINEELISLTDDGVELSPHFAKLTDTAASFARTMLDKHTFRGAFDRDSLNRIQQAKVQRGGKRGDS
jgi:hypothetical protein